MSRAVLTYPNPLLRKRVEYDPLLDHLEVYNELADAALDEEQQHEGLEIVGLAAPQIGIETRAFLFKLNGRNEYVIDPTVHEISKLMVTETEGCGSIPGYFCRVSRPENIVVSYRSLRSEWSAVAHIYGFAARVFLHELDHLDGILLFDREEGTPPSPNLLRSSY